MGKKNMTKSGILHAQHENADFQRNRTPILHIWLERNTFKLFKIKPCISSVTKRLELNRGCTIAWEGQLE